MWPVLCVGSQELGVHAGGQCLQRSFNNMLFTCILLQGELMCFCPVEMSSKKGM